MKSIKAKYLIKKAYEQGYKKGYEAGYSQGHREGYEAGVEDVLEEVEEIILEKGDIYLSKFLVELEGWEFTVIDSSFTKKQKRTKLRKFVLEVIVPLLAKKLNIPSQDIVIKGNNNRYIVRKRYKAPLRKELKHLVLIKDLKKPAVDKTLYLKSKNKVS